MRTRRFAASSPVVPALAVLASTVLALAGCGGDGAASPSPSGGSRVSPPAASTPASETISGLVSAGVEPHCLVLQDDKGSHVLFFPDQSLKASAPAGSRVTLVGYPDPRRMTSCQQGVPFIVTSVTKG